MFEVNDRVVCVDDSPVATPGGLRAAAITKHEIYTVEEVYPGGTSKSFGPVFVTFDCDCIGVGVPMMFDVDAWPAKRFRKILDIRDFAALETSVDLPLRELEGV